METTRLRVTLLGVEPTVIRVIDVPAVSTLPELHEQLQAAVGWTDSHLHQFVTDEALYGVPDLDAMEDERDETGVLLRDLPARFSYLYDFGDGWDHTIEVIGRGDDQPGCRYGEGMCPPEDVGGVSGYAELLAVLADPAHEDHRQLHRSEIKPVGHLQHRRQPRQTQRHPRGQTEEAAGDAHSQCYDQQHGAARV